MPGTSLRRARILIGAQERQHSYVEIEVKDADPAPRRMSAAEQAEFISSHRQQNIRRFARDLLRELERIPGPDEPETTGLLHNVSDTISRRRDAVHPGQPDFESRLP